MCCCLIAFLDDNDNNAGRSSSCLGDSCGCGSAVHNTHGECDGRSRFVLNSNLQALVFSAKEQFDHF